jgi:hypothetical protein
MKGGQAPPGGQPAPLRLGAPRRHATATTGPTMSGSASLRMTGVPLNGGRSGPGPSRRWAEDSSGPATAIGQNRKPGKRHNLQRDAAIITTLPVVETRQLRLLERQAECAECGPSEQGAVRPGTSAGPARLQAPAPRWPAPDPARRPVMKCRDLRRSLASHSWCGGGCPVGRGAGSCLTRVPGGGPRRKSLSRKGLARFRGACLGAA